MFNKLRAIALSLIFASSLMIPVFAAPTQNLDEAQLIQPELAEGDSGLIYGNDYVYDTNTCTLTFTNPNPYPYDPDDDANNVTWPRDTEILKNVTKVVVSKGYTYVPICNTDIKPVNVETIELPDGIEIIPNYAFRDFSELSTINLPDTLTTLGLGAFSGCSSLKTISLPESLTKIGSSAFSSCHNLSSLHLPAGLLKDGAVTHAFTNMPALERLYIPYDCNITPEDWQGSPRVHVICCEEVETRLKASESFHDISYSLTNQDRFSGTFGDSFYWSIDMMTETLMISGFGPMPDYTLEAMEPDPNVYPEWYPQRNLVKNIVIGNDVTSIGDYAFYDLANLKECVVPENIKIVGKGAFRNCDSLSNITFLSDTLTISSEGLYTQNLKEITILALDSDLELGTSAIYLNDNTTIYGYKKGYVSPEGCIWGYVVTFDDSNEGGTLIPDDTLNPMYIRRLLNDEIGSLPPVTTQKGYTFDGWFTEKEGGDMVDETTSFKENTRLYARWTPDAAPSEIPSILPSEIPSEKPSVVPSEIPSEKPSVVPSEIPSEKPSVVPSEIPSEKPSVVPSEIPSEEPSVVPSEIPSEEPSVTPSEIPSEKPSVAPSAKPSAIPSIVPSLQPSPNITILPDGTKIEKTVENKPGGFVNTQEKTTKTSGEINLKIVSTTTDKEKQTTVNMTIQSTGELKKASVEVANVTKTKKLTINLDELKAMVDQIKACQTESIHPIGINAVQGLGALLGSQEELSPVTLGVTQKKANVAIKISAKTPSGNTRYTVNMKQTDLTKNKYVVYRNDKKNNPVMVDPKKNTVKVSASRDLSIKINQKGTYQLQNTKDAAKTNKLIIKTVVPKKINVTVNSGQKATFKLSPKCNTANISKIKYSASNSNVKVSTKGKIQAKLPGTSKVTATVTMLNGVKKKIQMKVKVS